jgi:hypothetical protein
MSAVRRSQTAATAGDRRVAAGRVVKIKRRVLT